MKSLIIIGKNSDIAKYVCSRIEIVYDNIITISINTQDNWDFPNDSYDVIDFNVVGTSQTENTYKQLISRLHGKIDKYVLISTVMHGKEKSLFLSSYRKFKIKQESWLRKLLKTKLSVVYSPDVLDSAMWSSILVSEGVYKLDSAWNKQITLKGTTKENLLKHIEGKLNGSGKGLMYKSAYLTCTNERINSKPLQIKAILVYILSKSIIFSELMSRKRKVKQNENIIDNSNTLKFYGGGFADL